MFDIYRPPPVVLACPGAEVVSVKWAHWGRYLAYEEYCSGEGLEEQYLTNNLDCASTTAYGVISSLCDDQPSCSINTTKIVLGNPCTNVFKYLVIIFWCT